MCALHYSKLALTIQPVGAGAIVEIHFLHERGRAFAVYVIAILIGSTAGPTLSGFIVQHAPWPVQYWYNIALEGLIVLLTFFFLQETGYARDGSAEYPVMPKAFLANRVATFLTGKVVPKKTAKELVSDL
jgi:MFS family permease